ncbi:MAG: alpha/beta fold hydrolase [Pseudomonadota bacterium]
MELHHHDYDHTDGAACFDLVMLHGLFGAGSNFRKLSQHLSDEHRVLAADLRNHGGSPHAPAMDYPDLVADVADLIYRECAGHADLFGHSMGGKTAMGLALTYPDTVERLVVVDIAPVSYGHSDVFCRYIEAMAAVPLASIDSRREADAHLQAAVPDGRVRAFLLHSLRRDAAGGWCWRINLDALSANMDRIAAFPFADAAPFPGPALFVAGGASTYVLPEHHDTIRQFFPAARIEVIPDAGHWVHADRPAELEALVRPFLSRRGAAAA